MQLKDAHDTELSSLSGNTKCMRYISAGKFRPSFVYDLKTRERRFKLHSREGLCPEGRAEGKEEAAEALRKYFGQLSIEKATGFPLDETKLDKEKATKLLTDVEHLGRNRYGKGIIMGR